MSTLCVCKQYWTAYTCRALVTFLCVVFSSTSRILNRLTQIAISSRRSQSLLPLSDMVRVFSSAQESSAGAPLLTRSLEWDGHQWVFSENDSGRKRLREVECVTLSTSKQMSVHIVRCCVCRRCCSNEALWLWRLRAQLITQLLVAWCSSNNASAP